MVCESCGAANKESAKFCKQCGGALALRCPGCGAPYDSEDRFCDECGFALTEQPCRG